MPNNKRQLRQERREAARQRNVANDGGPLQEDSDELSTRFFEAEWRGSRSGAISGRGYHYQDAVGALLALRMRSGDLQVTRIVPEGLEDLSCDGAEPVHVQAKSRQARVGEFPRVLAARHLLEAWHRQHRRLQFDPESRLVLVLEQPVEGSRVSSWDVPLALAEDAGPLIDQLRKGSVETNDFEKLIQGTCVCVLSYESIWQQGADLVHRLTGIPAGAASSLVRGVQALVADRSDRNAAAHWESRSGLDDREVALFLTEQQELVDVNGLEEALREGLCAPVDFDQQSADRGYYQGRSTQPGHVASGLVVSRPEPTDAVLRGLDDARQVLVAGPSGVGKSAVMWMAAYVSRHVLWYRVSRLQVGDSAKLMRLARASGAGRTSTVGFVVDGVGVGALGGWDELAMEVAAQPGTVLLGSVREEDLLPLATVSGCVIVRPELDETLAEHIHSHLRDDGSEATLPAHWREAFEACRGLTLEFTHLLTRGRRLAVVIAEQVRRRIQERRDAELEALAIVAAADRWGASLRLGSIGSALNMTTGELRSALGRLNDEHLVTVNGDVIRGLHPLRSAAASDEIASHPPPALADLASTLASTVAPDDLAALVTNAIGHDGQFATRVIDALATRILAGDLRAMPPALNGLRLAGLTTAAQADVSALDLESVPAPLRSLTLDLAMIQSDLTDALDPRVRAAVHRLRADRSTGGEYRDLLVSKVRAHIPSVQTGINDSPKLMALLGVLAGSDPEPVLDLDHLFSVQETLDGHSAAQLIQAARDASPSTAARLLVRVDSNRLLSRFLSLDPWLLDLRIEVVDGDQVLAGTRAFVSDRVTPNPRDAVVDHAKAGLGAMPELSRADIRSVFAGGIAYEIGGRRLADTGLIQQYVHGPAEIEWNQARSRASRAAVSSGSQTEYLSLAHDLLVETASFARDVVTVWCLGIASDSDLERINTRRGALAASIESITLPGLSEIELTDHDHAFAGDPVHGLAQGLVVNMPPRIADGSNFGSLAAFVGDNLRRDLEKCRRLPWSLIGEAEPTSLRALDGLLTAMHTLFAEMAWGASEPSRFTRAARSAPRMQVIEKTAAAVESHAKARSRTRAAEFEQRLRAAEIDCSVLVIDGGPHAATNWPAVDIAVCVRLRSLVDLGPAHEQIAGLWPEADVGPDSATVFALRGGRIASRFGAKVWRTGTILPSQGIPEHWAAHLPEAWPTPFANAVTSATDALFELSGMAYVMNTRGSHPDHQVEVDFAWLRLREALDTVSAANPNGGMDEVLALLRSWESRVQEEMTGHAPHPWLAGEIGAGMSQPNEQVQLLAGLAILSTEWDIDPASTLLK